MNIFRLRYWITVAPIVLAFASLCLICLAIWRQWYSPHEGIEWSFRSGLVSSVEPAGPAAGLLRQGDRILSIDGVRVAAVELYERSRAGAPLHFDILRDGQPRSVLIAFDAPSLALILTRQIPHLVALVFWLVSISVILFKPGGEQSGSFFLFCQSISVVLATGGLGVFGPIWMDLVYRVVLGWVGPAAIHFHLNFPRPFRLRYRRGLIYAVYLLALLISLPDLLAPWLVERSTDTALITVRALFVAVGMVTSGLLLAWAYRQAASPALRRQIGIVALGGVVAFIPFSFLVVLPFALSLYRQPVIPFSIGFLLLLAIPLTYGYAVLNYHFIRLDRYMSRGVAYLLVFTFLAGLYYLLTAGLYRLVPATILQQPITQVVIVLLLAATATPLRQRIQKFVNELLYGGWYDYRSAVRHINLTLGKTEDRSLLEQSLTQGMQTVMQLDCARLLLRNKESALCIITACPQCLERGAIGIQLNSDSPIYQYFQTQRHPVGGTVLRRMLANHALSEMEAGLLGDEHARLWVPLVAPDALLGICILGPKHGGEDFDEEDFDILQMVAWQASIAIENRQLIDELRERAIMSDKLHQQVLRAREEERKYVARELHDQIIQSLVGLNYHLARLRPSENPDINEQIDSLQLQVRQTLEDIRRICSHLRPPTLDSLGLVAAMRSYIRSFESASSAQLMLRVEGDVDRWLPEEVSLCLFRFLQEALINVRKHATARRVEVSLQINLDTVCLNVRDDGVGFHVPPRLEHLVAHKHFGLAGLQERLELLDGACEVTSVLGRGTSLRASIPLSMDDGHTLS
jgi:signal transduction histidine kinase